MAKVLMECDRFELRMESRTAAYRKVVKPLLEKRRRARMNSSLNELKAFIVDAKKAEISDPSKLEKADILELTVRHLRDLRRQQRVMSSRTTATKHGNADTSSRYCAGFVECAQEVGIYLAALPGLDPALKARLLSHLSSCIGRESAPNPAYQSSPSYHAIVRPTNTRRWASPSPAEEAPKPGHSERCFPAPIVIASTACWSTENEPLTPPAYHTVDNQIHNVNSPSPTCVSPVWRPW